MILTALSLEEAERLRELLDLAETSARNPREEEFVAGTAERFDAYGQDTNVSDAQWKWLQVAASVVTCACHASSLRPGPRCVNRVTFSSM